MATTVKTTKVSQKFDSPEDVADLVAEISAASDSLETLILEGNSYGIEAARALGEALGMCPRVKHLGLNDLFVSRLKSEIPEALRLMFGGVMSSGAQVEILNLNDNAIGPVTMPELLPFLESNSCASLKVLRLNNCGLGIKGGNMLSTVLSRLELLQELIIGRNRLEIDGIRDISNSLSQLNSLEVLELPQNGTKADGIVALAQAITANPRLRILNLNDNVLKNQDALLAEAIRGLANLEVLNLGDCLLKTAGCISILGALQHLANANGTIRLRELILNGNEIGKRAGETIIATIETILRVRAYDDQLLKIDLSTNCFGQDLVDQLRGQFENSIELVIDDDEGSGDEEHQDDTRGGAGGDEEDDEVTEASPTKDKGDQEQGPVPDVDSLVAKYESSFTDLPTLSSKFFWVASKGYRGPGGSLGKRTDVELEAIIKVGLAHQAANSEFDFVNALLVACGLIKSENRSLMPARDQDLTGGLLALGMSLKHFNTSEQKKCLTSFLQKITEQPQYESIKSNIFSFIYSF